MPKSLHLTIPAFRITPTPEPAFGTVIDEGAWAESRIPDLMGELEARLAERVEVHGDTEDELVSNANRALAEAVKRVAQHHRDLGVNILVIDESQETGNVTAAVLGLRDAPPRERR